MRPPVKGTQAEFIKSLPWPKDWDLTWNGPIGYLKLDDNRHARFGMSIRGKQSGPLADDHWVSIEVDIHSKSRGLLATEHFVFDDHLKQQIPAGEAPKIRGIYILGYVGWDWYIYPPVTTQPLMDAIQRYIDLWK
jgi:hypothetical protein